MFWNDCKSCSDETFIKMSNIQVENQVQIYYLNQNYIYIIYYKIFLMLES
jgi:hypothetical protein